MENRGFGTCCGFDEEVGSRSRWILTMAGGKRFHDETVAAGIGRLRNPGEHGFWRLPPKRAACYTLAASQGGLLKADHAALRSKSRKLNR